MMYVTVASVKWSLQSAQHVICYLTVDPGFVDSDRVIICVYTLLKVLYLVHYVCMCMCIYAN